MRWPNTRPRDVVDAAVDELEAHAVRREGGEDVGLGDVAVADGEGDDPSRMAIVQRAQLLAGRHVFDDAGDEPAGGGVLRGGQHVEDGAALDDAAVLHHDDAVGERADDVHLVRDDEDRDAELRG